MIDTEALRSKILDLAIRGKLIEQLPEDGSAEDLYAKIQEEKAQLVKEGKIKKEKALPEITEDNIPFTIPKNWKWVRLGDISAKISSGNTPAGGKKSDVYVENGYCFFREQNIYDDGIHEEGLVYITEELFKTRVNCTVLPMDILLNITGGSIGRCAMVPDNFTKGSINQHILIIRMIDPRLRFYVHRCICSPYVQKYIKGNVVGDKEGFSGGRCKNLLIPLPPVDEQKRIIDKVNDILERIDEIEILQSQYASNVEILKGKLIDAGIRGKLTEQLPEDGDAEDLYNQVQDEKARLIKEGKFKKEKPLPEIAERELPFEIPKNWKWVRWGNVINIVSARRVHQSDWRNEGIPFYRAREIARLADKGTVNNDLFISEDLYNEFSKSGIPQCGDLMVTGVGTLGKAYVVKENDKFYYKDASVLCFENYAGLDAIFLKKLMESDLMQTQINSNSGGTTVDTLTMVRMNQYLMPLPPLSEQRRIVERLEAIMEQL